MKRMMMTSPPVLVPPLKEDQRGGVHGGSRNVVHLLAQDLGVIVLAQPSALQPHLIGYVVMIPMKRRKNSYILNLDLSSPLILHHKILMIQMMTLKFLLMTWM